jgi:hypothetical protein
MAAWSAKADIDYNRQAEAAGGKMQSRFLLLMVASNARPGGLIRH